MFVNWTVLRFRFQGWALVGPPGSPIWTLERSREGSGSLFLLLLTFSPPPDLAALDNLLGQKLGFLSGSPLPILGIGEAWGHGTPRLPFPVPFGGGRVWWHLCNNVRVSLSPATGTGECTLFWGMSRRRPSFLSCFSCPVLQNSLPSPELTGAYMRTGNLRPTHTRCLPWLRGAMVAVVAVGAAGRAVPASSWPCRLDCKVEAGAARGVSRICRCLPPSLPSPPSQGRHKALSLWSSGANTSTSTGISWPWPPATPCPLSCASGWYSHSLTPSPAACCSFKLPSGSLHTLPISQGGPWAPERQTQNLSGCCGRTKAHAASDLPFPQGSFPPP